MNHARTNFTLRSLVWFGALAWWVYLRKPRGSSLLDIRTGITSIVAIVLVVIGLFLWLWAARSLAGAVPGVLRPPAVTLMRGPYGYIRNPLYLAAALVFAGMSTLYAPWSLRDLVSVAAIAVLLHIYVVRCEEPASRRRLGPVYDGYCAVVPRWIPKFFGAQPALCQTSVSEAVQHAGAVDGTQPIRSETNSTSSAAGSRP